MFTDCEAKCDITHCTPHETMKIDSCYKTEANRSYMYVHDTHGFCGQVGPVEKVSFVYSDKCLAGDYGTVLGHCETINACVKDPDSEKYSLTLLLDDAQNVSRVDETYIL